MKLSAMVRFFVILSLCLLVFVINMTLAPKIPAPLLMGVRLSFIAVCLLAWRRYRHGQQPYASRLAFVLMAVNLAFFAVSFVTPAGLGLNLASPDGIAYAKLGDSVVISFVLICTLLLGGFSLKDLYLEKGKWLVGFAVGIVSFVIMAFLAFSDAKDKVAPGYLNKNLIWILIFIFSNAFLEELLFRGIFLKTINKFLKPGFSILLTSIVFACAHLQVAYTPDVLIFAGIVFVLALLWAFLMHQTQSIIASFLFHAGADLMIIIPIYISFGANVK